MNSIIQVKLSVSNICYSNPDGLVLIASFNSLPHFLKPPFKDELLYLINFPVVTTLSLTLIHSNRKYEASVDLKDLISLNPLHLLIDLTSSDQESPEMIQPMKSISLLIEKSDIETSGQSAEIEHFATVSQSTFDAFLHYSKQQITSEESRDLGVEILEIGDYKETTPQKIKNIQSMLFGVNEKLKVFEIIKKRLVELEKEAARGNEKHEKTLNRFKLACYEFLGYKNSLEITIKNLNTKVTELNEKNLSLLRTLKNFEEDLKDKDKEIEALELKLEIQTSIALKSTPINQYQVPGIEIPEDKFSAIISKYELIISEYKTSIDSLTQENESLSLENHLLKSENSSLKHEFSVVEQENQTLQSSILGFSTASIYTEELESQLRNLESINKKLKEDYQELQACMSSSTKVFHSSTLSFSEEKSILLETNKILKEEYSELKQKLIELEGKYLEIQLKSYDSSQDTLLPLTELTTQNLQLLKDSKDFCEISNKLESSMLSEYHLVIRKIIDVSSNFLLQSRLQSSILMYLRDKESEITLLKNVISEIQKQKVVYIPVRGDYVDLQLANFLNSMPVPCEVPFARLDHGIYLFGTKRVVLRVENIGIVIRVGGGYIKLEDFINNQSVFELGKIRERKSKPSSPEKVEVERVHSPNKLNSQKPPIQKKCSSSVEKKMVTEIPFSLTDKKETTDISQSFIKPILIEDDLENKGRLEITKKNFFAKRNNY